MSPKHWHLKRFLVDSSHTFPKHSTETKASCDSLFVFKEWVDLDLTVRAVSHHLRCWLLFLGVTHPRTCTITKPCPFVFVCYFNVWKMYPSMWWFDKKIWAHRETVGAILLWPGNLAFRMRIWTSPLTSRLPTEHPPNDTAERKRMICVHGCVFAAQRVGKGSFFLKLLVKNG